MEKFLKKDIIDLLNDSLDINAYGRAEGLLIELNMSACYDFVMRFCVSLYKQVSLMDKERKCPVECKEAVQSLMYAAARFADMPELRELRAIFLEKYGNSLEANISHEFVEKLKAKPSTKEMKIQLLQDIALESGKPWDSKALLQKLYVSPSSEYVSSEDSKDEIVNKIKKDSGSNRRGSSVPSSLRKIKDQPSYRTGKINKDRYELQENENKPEIKLQKTESDEKKPFQNKYASPPYHIKSNIEIKYGNNVLHGSDFGNMPNKEIQGQSCNKNEEQNTLKSGEKEHGGENDEIHYYQRKISPVKSDEKLHFQSKFSPTIANTRKKAETFLNNDKTQKQDESVEKAEPKPKSVRSVQSRHSTVPPNEEKIMKNDDILNVIRRELATKPGHKSTIIDEDLMLINDVLMHTKRDLQFKR